MAEWVRVTELAKLPEKALVPFTVEGQEVVLLRMGDKVSCFGDYCTHQDVKLSDFGEVENGELVCWAHGAKFDLDSGAPLCFPASEALKKFTVKIEDDAVFVKSAPA